MHDESGKIEIGEYNVYKCNKTLEIHIKSNLLAAPDQPQKSLWDKQSNMYEEKKNEKRQMLLKSFNVWANRFDINFCTMRFLLVNFLSPQINSRRDFEVYTLLAASCTFLFLTHNKKHKSAQFSANSSRLIYSNLADYPVKQTPPCRSCVLQFGLVRYVHSTGCWCNLVSLLKSLVFGDW